MLRVPVSSCFALRNLSLCETEGFKNPCEVLHLLSELSYLLIAVGQRSGRDAFRCIGRPQVRLAFLLVFCHGCRQQSKSAVTIRLWHRSPDCQVAVTPPDSVPQPCSATTVEKSKTKQKHDVTKPCTQCVFFHWLNNLSQETRNVQHRHSAD